MKTINWSLKFIIPLFILCGFYILANEVIRNQTVQLLVVFSVLFALLWFWIKNYSSLSLIFILGIFSRMIFMYNVPELSQDFYRFIWDGSIQLLGINPYLFTPKSLIEIIDFPNADLLYQKMGSLSAGNYSNYPPFSQYLYKILGYFNYFDLDFPVYILKLIYFGGDIITYFIGIKLLERVNLAPEYIAWYFLNPLLIIEGIGNLHGEGLMVCFTLISCLYIIQKKTILGGFFLSLSIATKLLPLLVFPLFYHYLGVGKFLFFSLSLLIFSLCLWLPFYEGEMLIHYKETIDLWFTSFEFNGSIYNIVRAIGYEVKGYNIIKQLGKVTPYINIGIIIIFTFLPSNRNIKLLFKNMLFLLSSYFFISTTVHPWYIINLIMLGILSGYAFPIIWSLTVFWSYSAYGLEEVREVLPIQLTSYLLVYGCLILELMKGPFLWEHFQKADLFSIQHSPISPR